MLLLFTQEYACTVAICILEGSQSTELGQVCLVLAAIHPQTKDNSSSKKH